jgi:branched-chain amino acid transport system permease protein
LRFTIKDLLVIILASILMIALRLFVQRTRLGKAMRATAQNRDAAKMLGIDIDWVITATFLIGGGLAGAAGLMAGLYNNTAWWFMGFRAGLQSFTAAVLGGIGNITGAMLGGFLIGLLASFSDGYLNARWTNAWVFATLVLILLFRPTGLLGEQTGQKA